jgi:hypothetical protein
VVGHDPVPLLRHRRVEGSEAGLDVRQPRPAPTDVLDLARHDRAGQGGVRVAVDQHPVRLDVGHDRLESAHHLGRLDRVRSAPDFQVEARRRHLEIPEEGRAHRVVVMLPGVDQQLGVLAEEGAADGRGLHELRASADHGEDLHDPSSPGRGGMCSPQRGHGPWNGVPSGASRSGSPQGHALPIRRAGLPTTSS